VPRALTQVFFLLRAYESVAMATRRSILASPTVQTLGIFLAVFLVSRLLVAAVPPLVGLFTLDRPLAQPWTLVTSVYAHANLPHLVSNSVVLVIVGIPLERATTTWAYHTYFVVTGAIAGAVQVLLPDVVGWVVSVIDAVTLGLVSLSTPGNVAVLGASGAVFAMLGYVATGNRLTRGILDSVSAELRVALLFVVAVAVTLATASPGVALVAHFTGLLIGLFAGRAGVLPSRGRRSGNTSYNTTHR
jgi:membrane associated rhomboid family serine protease